LQEAVAQGILMVTLYIKTQESRVSIHTLGEQVLWTKPTFLSTVRVAMTSKLDVLAGMAVTDVLKVHGYVQLLFEKDISLNIYNELRLCNGDDLRALNGTMLLTVEEKQETLILYFSNGKRLDINLCDTAYSGPEALELNVPGQPTVVWN
jgi:hypothetical protein